ncbi:hypothetical protein IE53DRAFT_294570, partial [Violaceomyces palustris]
MPPPSFSSPVTPALPKQIQNWLKDLTSKFKLALAADEKALPAALQAVENLVREHTNVANYAASQDAAHAQQQAQLRSQISARVNAALLDIFHHDLSHDDQPKLAVLVDILQHVVPVLGAQSIVLEWWDLVLRPLLKNPSIHNATASKVRDLVVLAMVATPSSAYEDEQPPSAAWPAPAEKASNRKAGDAPYPLASAAPHSPQRRASDKQAVPGSSPAISAMRSAAVQNQDVCFRFTQRIYDLYLSETATGKASIQPDEDRVDEAADRDEDREGGRGDHQEEHANVVADPAGVTWKGNLESIILVFGNQKPKEFFHHVAHSFSEAASRVSLICLVTTFLRLYPIHTYHITYTALPRQLLLSLQLDTSTTCVSLGITALVMLIPHVPDWLANGGAGGLPVLLSIYARVVDWRKLGFGWEERVGEGPELDALRREKDEEFGEVYRLGKRLNVKPELKWQRLETTFDTALSSPPNAEQLFTYLYGLFPCNMIRFLRAPIDYLRKARFDSPFEGDWEEMMDEAAIQQRSSAIVRRHTLHPSLITLSAERELSDKQRWLRHDSADINAECMSLFLGKWHDVPKKHWRGESWGDALETPENGSAYGSPGRRSSLPEQDGMRRQTLASIGSPLSSAAKNYQTLPGAVNADDILLTYASLRSGASLTAGGLQYQEESVNLGLTSPPSGPARSIALNHVSSTPPSPITHATRAMTRTRSGSLSSVLSMPPPTATSPTFRQHPLSTSHVLTDRGLPMRPSKSDFHSELAFVQRENLLLRNELNFELYLKEQHLRHIGRLHRDRITDTALEAERQNLYHTVRSLKSQLASMKSSLERQRTEAAATKARHVHWEADLNVKIKNYREERKTWTAEARSLKAQTEENLATIDALSRRLEDSESQLFELKTTLQLVEPKLDRIQEYESKIELQSKLLALWDKDVRNYEAQRKEMEQLLSQRWEMEKALETTELALTDAQSKALKLEVLNERLNRDLE